MVNGLKCTAQNILMFLSTLFKVHMKSKKVGGILAKPVLEKGKTITIETLHLVRNVYEGDNFSS